MEDVIEHSESPIQHPTRQWTDILRHGTILILAALVFISIVLYFRELVLLIGFVLIWWIALIFVFLVFMRSLFVVLQSTRQWYAQQIGTSKLLFIFILIVLIVLVVVFFFVLVEKLQPIYGDRFSLLQMKTLPLYLSFQKNSINPAEVVQELHRLVNEERAAYQLSILKYDSALEMIAQA